MILNNYQPSAKNIQILAKAIDTIKALPGNSALSIDDIVALLAANSKVLSDQNYTSIEKTKLAGIAASANNYVHPSADGSHHVPATSTTNDGKVLKSGATAGSEAWAQLTQSDITNLTADLAATDTYEQYITKGLGIWVMQCGSASLKGAGIADPAFAATAAATYDPTTFLGTIPRVKLTTAATTNAVALIRQSVKLMSITSGIKFSGWVSVTDAVYEAGASFLIGPMGTASALTGPISPFTLTQQWFGFGNDATDTNFSIYSNDGTGNATKVTLTNMPCNTVSTDVYFFSFAVAPGGTSIAWTVIRKSASTGATVQTQSGTIITDMPAANTTLCMQAIRCINAGTLAASVDLSMIRMSRT